MKMVVSRVFIVATAEITIIPLMITFNVIAVIVGLGNKKNVNE